jgi:hypothetical protein
LLCKKLDIPKLSKELAQELISFAENKFYNESNDFSESYSDKDNNGAVVSFFMMPDSLHKKVEDAIGDHPLLSNYRRFYVQLVYGGNEVPLHTDEYSQRRVGVNYLLKDGGNVKTTWWEPKEHYKDMDIPCSTLLDKELFKPIETYTMEENNWYRMTFDHPHNAENIESLRLSLAVLFYDLGDPQRNLSDDEH